jgi:hypothetical protein
LIDRTIESAIDKRNRPDFNFQIRMATCTCHSLSGHTGEFCMINIRRNIAESPVLLMSIIFYFSLQILTRFSNIEIAGSILEIQGSESLSPLLFL